MISQKTDAANRYYQAGGQSHNPKPTANRSDRYEERVWIARACITGMLACIGLALIFGGY